MDSHSPPRECIKLLYIIFLLIVSTDDPSTPQQLLNRSGSGFSHRSISISPPAINCTISSTVRLRNMLIGSRICEALQCIKSNNLLRCWNAIWNCRDCDGIAKNARNTMKTVGVRMKVQTIHRARDELFPSLSGLPRCNDRCRSSSAHANVSTTKERRKEEDTDLG